MKRFIVVIFFLLQLGGIILAKQSPVNYFAWVPFDQITTYRVFVQIDSIELSPEEISHRYNISNPGRENRSVGHLFDRIRQYENTYGRLDSAEVRLVYKINGNDEQQWLYNR